MQKELSLILGYVKKLEELDTSKVEATFHSVLVENIVREDQERSCSAMVNSKILELAPDKKDRFLKVKKVL